MEKAKEPIKIWAKPLRNGNKALYLRRYIAGSHSKGYVYEKLDGLFLIDDKKGKDKIAKERNNNALQIAAIIKCERIKEYMNGMVGIKKKALRDMALKDWMLTYAERKKAQGQSGSNAATIRNTMLHLIIYRGEFVRMSQLDKAYCEGFVIYLANAMTIGFDKPKRGQHHQKKDMTYNPKERCWELKDVTLTDGEMKFRHTNDWSLSWGGELDNLTTQNGPNIAVAAGTYDIKLEVNWAEGTAKCEMTKK